MKNKSGQQKLRLKDSQKKKRPRESLRPKDSQKKRPRELLRLKDSLKKRPRESPRSMSVFLLKKKPDERLMNKQSKSADKRKKPDAKPLKKGLLH